MQQTLSLIHKETLYFHFCLSPSCHLLCAVSGWVELGSPFSVMTREKTCGSDYAGEETPVRVVFLSSTNIRLFHVPLRDHLQTRKKSRSVNKTTTKASKENKVNVSSLTTPHFQVICRFQHLILSYFMHWSASPGLSRMWTINIIILCATTMPATNQVNTRQKN